jgi:hypothetical protein
VNLETGAEDYNREDNEVTEKHLGKNYYILIENTWQIH